MKCRALIGFFLFLGLLAVSPGYAERILRLASTTSTQASGLLDVLLPAFEKRSGYNVVLSVTGSGKALQLGRTGRADLLWVHSAELEQAFVAAGHGVKRHYTMHNDFLIVGPKNDPAGLAAAVNVRAAMQRLAAGEALFISRADDSGTHHSELKLWELAGIDPYQRWYYELGQGMQQTLAVADEKQAYLLVDRATWLFRREDTSLKECFQNDPALLTEYSLIAVDPARHAGANYRAAMTFIDFVTSATGRRLITSHKVAGKTLFKLSTASE